MDSRPTKVLLHFAALAGAAIAATACRLQPPPETLVEKGERIFFTETFAGNGRTCRSCHRPEDNFGLSANFGATLAPDDALFVAERDPALAQNFENPRLMRGFALILENQDGFDDLAANFNLRGIPHTLALRTSVASSAGPRTGWGGDGAPGDGSLRAFATGAVIQHFTRTLARVPGVDFRLPTDDELDALEAFQLSLGRQQDLALPLPLVSPVAARGQAIFLDNTLGKCNICHFNAGANADPRIFGPSAGNRSFDTGVEDLPDQPARLTGEPVSGDDGFGIPGNGEFNTPPLVEAADTAPFFHNNSVATLESAVGFYDGEAFNDSPAGRLLKTATGSGIELDATRIAAIAAFLRVLNALENLREVGDLATRSIAVTASTARGTELLGRALEELDDAATVLRTAELHPQTVAKLAGVRQTLERAREARAGERARQVRSALVALPGLRGEMVRAN